MSSIIFQYQTLIGSFLGVVLPIGLWYLKDVIESKREKENEKKEIENIFMMATRESEDAVKDLERYVATTKEGHNKNSGEMHVFIPSKFNRIHINEERLFQIKKDLSFEISQQVDIAASSAKKFNSYLESFEKVPYFIFDANLRMLSAGIYLKEKSLSLYLKDQEDNIQLIEELLKYEIPTIQRHLFRPIAAIARDGQKVPRSMIDKTYDNDAELLLLAMKKELSEKI